MCEGHSMEIKESLKKKKKEEEEEEEGMFHGKLIEQKDEKEKT